MKFAVKKINILPHEPVDICGYGFSRGKSSTCEDEIAAVVSMLDDGSNKFIFASIDTCYVTKALTDAVREFWERSFGVKKECIVIAATHTHSGPGICHCPDDHLTGSPALENIGYLSEMIEKLTAAVNICADTLQECVVSYGFVPITHCFGNRNDKEGDYLENAVIWKITDIQDQRAAMIVHLNCHSTVFKGNYLKLSSDLIGRVRMELEERWKVPVMVFVGAAGDVSTRFYVETPIPSELKKCAASICDQIEQEIDWTKIAYDQKIKEKTIRWHSEYVPREQESFCILLKQCKEKFPFMQARMEQIGECRKIEIDTELSIYRIVDMNIVCIPGEILTKFARHLENCCDGKIAFIGCANDYWHYFVPQEEYGKYFESYNSFFPKGEADRMFMEVKKQLMDRF